MTFWSDWNEPDETIEGRDVGLYDNITLPLAPDWRRMRLVRGLPFNGGSNALDFDSAAIETESGATVPDLAIWNLRGQRNAVPVSTLPDGLDAQSKVTVIARVWIDGTSDLETAGNFISPCYVGWASSGAFGESYVVIGRYAPYTDEDGGGPRIWLVVESFDGSNAEVYDCGSAAGLIGHATGHEFKLVAEIIPATEEAFDKMRATLTVTPLAGGSGGVSLTQMIENQNLLNGGGFWVSTLRWFECRRNGAGYVHARCYSFEFTFGDVIGGP